MSATRINSNTGLLQAILAFVLFSVACYIYIVYRSNDMVLYSWLHINPHCDFFEVLRSTKIALPTWMIYNLPDALWLIAYLLFIDILWEDWSWLKICFIAAVPLFAYCIEVLQFGGFVSGTGDILDILSYTIALVVYGLIVN